MSRVRIMSIRGWRGSDSFPLTIIGVIDTLQDKGLVEVNVEERMSTVGELSLALIEHLDYYNLILLPELNKLIKSQNTLDPNDYNSYLRLTMFLTTCINTLNTFNELLLRFIISIVLYIKGPPYIKYDSLTKTEKENFKKLAREIISEAQKGKNNNAWYSFIDKVRNFVNHEGALLPSYIENGDLVFLKKNTDNSKKYGLKEIVNKLKEFNLIKRTTRKGLSDIELWKRVLTNIKRDRSQKYSTEELIRYIDEHFRHDLTLLLCACKSWELLKDKSENKHYPYRFKDYAMITTCTYARSFFEFFTSSTDRNKINYKRGFNYLTWEDFELKERLKSPLYKDDWIGPINNYIMHTKERLEGGNRVKNIDLKNMPTLFTEEVLRLWKVFEEKVPQKYRGKLIEVRQSAIKKSLNVKKVPI